MNSPDETIVAIATPLGEGGLGVVRLSGPRAFQIAELIFHSAKKITDAVSHTLHHGWIVKGQDLLDEAVVAVFRAPHSYTGDDVIEFSCHGSPAVLKETVRLCEKAGARLAEPGEFTQRAYLNGKLDLLQAEAVADLIHAQSSKARAAAANQLRGNLSDRVKAIREPLIALLAHIEANLDFVEEDIPDIARDKISTSLKKISADLENLLSTSVKGRILRNGLHVALAGKPNVGKSSLFNALLAQDRAIVTGRPGTTRDTLEERIEWNGLPIVLTDTAGLRPTGDEVESQGTERARRAHQAADAVLLVLDGSERFAPEDANILEGFKHKPFVVALNKSDKAAETGPDALPAEARLRCVRVSAKTGAGLAELKAKLMETVESKLSSPESETAPVVANLRHAGHLEKALQAVNSAGAALADKRSEEALALDLRAALEEIGAITGESVTEDVLTSIFSQFCIGK